MTKALSTMEYGLFQKMEGNREIDRYHLKRLVESILNHNQLKVHPIVIDEQYRIIDGQHRLEAAKQLGVEIFFMKADDITEDHIIHSNVNQLAWEIEDYINYFAAKKIQSYIELKKMLKITLLKPKSLLTLLLGNVNRIILNNLKVGKFELPKNDEDEQLVNFFLQFIHYAKNKQIKLGLFTNFNFTKSLRWLYKTTGFDKDTFFRKLDQRCFELQMPRGNSQEWYKVLIGIYNFKNHNKLDDRILSEK